MAYGGSGGDQADKTEKIEKQITKGITVVLDQVISANSMFTVAVFLGLAFATPKQEGLESRPECSVDTNTAKRLVVYEVVSFACFLLSNLVAGSMKVFIHIIGINRKEPKPIDWKKGFMFFVSIASSLFGVGLLVASIVCVVEIKLGKLHCGSPYARTAVIWLLVLVVVAWAVYLAFMLVANLYIFFARSVWLGNIKAEDRKSQGS